MRQRLMVSTMKDQWLKRMIHFSLSWNNRMLRMRTVKKYSATNPRYIIYSTDGFPLLHCKENKRKTVQYE